MSAVQGMINRITAVPTDHLEPPSRRAGLCCKGVVRLPPRLAGLARLPNAQSTCAGMDCGTVAFEIERAYFAAIAGLGCRPMYITTKAPQPLELAPAERSRAHFVLDGHVIGPLLPRERDAMVAFARLWGARLVEIETISEEGGNAFVKATVSSISGRRRDAGSGDRPGMSP